MNIAQHLNALPGNGNGNLYEGQRPGDGETQRAFLRQAIEEVGPSIIFETGTNKAYFAAFLHEIGYEGHLVTCDPDREVSLGALKALYALLGDNPSLTLQYYDVSSQSPQFKSIVENTAGLDSSMAWVDGLHTEEGCYADLCLFGGWSMPILVDDFSYDSVRSAVHRFCPEYGYRIERVSTDARQIAYLLPT